MYNKTILLGKKLFGSSNFLKLFCEMKRHSILCLFLCVCLIGKSQFASYPQGYFSEPLHLPIRLSGNFGELRNNHYHMGLDFRTGGRVNLPVYAAADGFISRVKVEPVGFGQSLTIDHPNGYSTLYAHLNKFSPEIESWVKQHQYDRASWKITLYPTAALFPVKKGMLIGFSGNTGGSQAPHLHFEIRRTLDEACLNPMLFGFPMADHQRPRILKLAIYDRTKSTYEQSPQLVPVTFNTNNNYTTKPELIKVKSSSISLALTAYDSEDGSSNLNGIAAATLWIDQQKKISFVMDQIGYDDTRYLNAHVDYRTRTLGGSWLQHMSALPGYERSIYDPKNENGIFSLADGQIHAIDVEVKDAYGNVSMLHTRMQWEGTATTTKTEIKEGRIFYPRMLDVFESPTCEFFLGERSLYDKAFVGHQIIQSTTGAASDIHQIGARWIPLHDSILIRIKPNSVISLAEKEKMLMTWTNGVKKSVQRVIWQGAWAAARYRDFGNFQLIIDTIPPRIVPVNFKEGADLSNKNSLIFHVKDEYEKIRQVNVFLDGQWLRFSNDKNLAFVYRMDEYFSSGQHELKIQAEDEAGNITTQSFQVKR